MDKQMKGIKKSQLVAMEERLNSLLHQSHGFSILRKNKTYIFIEPGRLELENQNK